MTVHFICVHGDPVDTTSAIVHETFARLSARFDIVLHRPTDPITIRPKPGDILIGHPNRYGDCSFRRSFAQPGWARRIVFAPFSFGLPKDGALIDDLVMEADLYLATSGPYWRDGIAGSIFSHWQYKMLPFELGVNRGYFPQIRSRFNPPGQRRFLYIGNADAMKGGDYLADLADANPDLHFGWLRTSDGRHCLDQSEEPTTAAIRRRMLASRIVEHPPIQFRKPGALQITATYDFVINCGRSDAMPCEVLECAAWGLVPVTTPQCGYAADDWLTHIPLDQISEASAILNAMNNWSDAEMRQRQARGWQQLDQRFNWDRAAAQFEQALVCAIPEPPASADWQQRMTQNRQQLRQIVRRETRAELIQAARLTARRVMNRMRRAG